MGGSVGVLKERPLDKVFALAAPGWARRGPGAEPAAATIGAAGAVLPDDLGERTMIGDAGRMPWVRHSARPSSPGTGGRGWWRMSPRSVETG